MGSLSMAITIFQSSAFSKKMVSAESGLIKFLVRK